MKTHLNVIKEVSQIKDLNTLVTILELCRDSINIDTVSGMARKENKTPTGIRKSNKYKKIKIGDALLVVKGLDEDGFPF